MWKKIKTEIVHQNPWWVYHHDSFEIAGKTEPGEYYYVETPGSVLVIPIFNDGRIGLIKTFRCLFNKWSVEFPGGATKTDKSFEQSAREELQEEVGLGAEELINVGEFAPCNGIITEVCRVYLAKSLFKLEAANDPQEVIELMLRRVDEIDELVKHGQIWDGMTLAVWALIKPFLVK